MATSSDWAARRQRADLASGAQHRHELVDRLLVATQRGVARRLCLGEDKSGGKRLGRDQVEDALQRGAGELRPSAPPGMLSSTRARPVARLRS